MKAGAFTPAIHPQPWPNVTNRPRSLNEGRGFHPRDPEPMWMTLDGAAWRVAQ